MLEVTWCWTSPDVGGHVMLGVTWCWRSRDAGSHMMQEVTWCWRSHDVWGHMIRKWRNDCVWQEQSSAPLPASPVKVSVDVSPPWWQNHSCDGLWTLSKHACCASRSMYEPTPLVHSCTIGTLVLQISIILLDALQQPNTTTSIITTCLNLQPNEHSFLNQWKLTY